MIEADSRQVHMWRWYHVDQWRRTNRSESVHFMHQRRSTDGLLKHKLRIY